MNDPINTHFFLSSPPSHTQMQEMRDHMCVMIEQHRRQRSLEQRLRDTLTGAIKGWRHRV